MENLISTRRFSNELEFYALSFHFEYSYRFFRHNLSHFDTLCVLCDLRTLRAYQKFQFAVHRTEIEKNVKFDLLVKLPSATLSLDLLNKIEL